MAGLKSNKYIHSIQVEGYIHRSRVQFLEDIDNTEKKELLEDVILTNKKLVEHWHKLINTKKRNEAINEALWKASRYHDFNYAVVLEILPTYICQTKDSVTLHIFLSTMWMDSGSADESPSHYLGQCFLCQSDFVLEPVLLLKKKEQHCYFFDSIEHGVDICMDSSSEKERKEILKLLKKIQNKRKGIVEKS